MDAIVTRREALAAGGLCVGLALCGCSSQHHKEPTITTGVVNLGPASDYPAGSATTKWMQQYGITVVNQSGVVVAIRSKCTHNGCLAPWNDDEQQFVCPCHGSRFDMLGRVIKGPAKKPLPAEATQPGPGGTITVDLGKLYAM
ncbi:MAG TPA: ubiquinol-cytochrome c reductase iron-sulfur subunit [Phycisphaerae bacterium]|nr:ubiquinol-cytochrome c reductase iron-sulfur subunit [Phycisphaerae bacterium]